MASFFVVKKTKNGTFATLTMGNRLVMMNLYDTSHMRRFRRRKMSENYKTLREVAEEWGITVRRVQMLCVDGKLPGAKKLGKMWVVPADVERPVDKRVNPLEPAARLGANEGSVIKTPKIGNWEQSGDVRFVAHMSHDIRTSLNAILGYSDMIRAHKDESERVEEYTKKIQASGEAMLKLTTNVIDLARMQMGEEKVEEEVVNLDALLQRVYDQENVAAVKRRIALVKKVNIKHNNIYTDAKKLERILGNVLNNAVKFSDDDEVVQFKVEELPNEETGQVSIAFSIEDNGIGMTEGYLEQIYNSYILDEPDDDYQWGGNGLGMAIVKQLVELMQGTIEIESHLGFGTKVLIKMSYRQVDLDDVQSETQVVFDLADFSGKRILVADDNELNRDIAAEILGDLGLDVEVAEDGIICVAMLEKSDKNHYDYILMDLQMPHMDGFLATQLIRGLEDKTKANIPIIAMTASVLPEDREHAFAVGMNGFVEKPFEIRKLLTAMRICDESMV